MNCDCIAQMEQKLADKFEPQAGGPVRAECNNAVLSFGATVEVQTVIHFTVRGGLKRPFANQKGYQTFIVANYCPFCGKPAKAEPREETPA